MTTKLDDDINILFPDREVVIQGETLIIREYSISDAMKLYHEIDKLIEPLSKLLGKRERLDYNEVEELIATRYSTVLFLIAHAINKPVDFVANLGGREGYILLDTWWTVNSGFFINAAARKLFQVAGSNIANESSIGDESLQHSLEPDTVKET